MSETLKQKTARGLLWGALNNGTMQFIGLVFGIVLGRLLNPSDYGMIAMITIFTITATALQDSGFGTAIVNLDKPKDEDYNSVFWFNVLTGLLCYVILFFSAPLIARYYHHPQLVALSRYVFLSIIFSSLGVSQSAYLQKHLMVKQRAKANVAAVLVSSSVGVAMAWKGFAYWSLATQTNVYILGNVLFYWHYSHWRPTLHIDFGPVRRMFRFSCKILATTIIQQINNNILNILLGRYYSSRDAGYYNQAYQWNSKVIYLMQGMLGGVTQPVLVDLRNNSGRELAALRKAHALHRLPVVPPAVGFWSRGQGVYRAGHYRQVAGQCTLASDTEHWRCLPAAEHTVVEFHHQPRQVRHLLRQYACSLCSADCHHACHLSLRRDTDGGSHHAHQCGVGVCMVLFGSPTDSLLTGYVS